MKILKMPYPSDSGTVILADGGYPAGVLSCGLLQNALRVICCDGVAARFIAEGGRPEAIVGDCDSVPDDIRDRFAGILHYDNDQETNDLTKSVAWCLARGYVDITILGATGKREDHTIGNISLLGDYSRDATVRMVTDYGTLDPVSYDTRFESFSGQQVSVFTLHSDVRITTRNLRYPLYEAVLPGWWMGTLNESLGDEFVIGTTGPAVVYRLFGE